MGIRVHNVWGIPRDSGKKAASIRRWLADVTDALR
jgi:hypothetical protein